MIEKVEIKMNRFSVIFFNIVIIINKKFFFDF